MSYTDQTVYRLLLQLAAHDVAVTRIEFDPTDTSTIDRADHRAAVEPSSDGTRLEWHLLRYPGRGRWRLVDSGEGDETAARTAVLGHLRAAELW